MSNVTLHSLPLLMEASIDERGVQTSLSSFTKAIITHEHPIYLHNSITQIILPSNQYNSLTHLHMFGFPSLQLLQFGSFSFMNLTSFIIDNCTSLVSFVTQDHSLMSTISLSFSSIIHSILLNRSSIIAVSIYWIIFIL